MGVSLDDVLMRLQLDVSSLVNLLRSTRDDPLRRGRTLTGIIRAGNLNTTLTHGLGRAYQGMIVQYAANLASNLTAQEPTAASDKTIAVYLGAVQANDVTFSIWVY